LSDYKSGKRQNPIMKGFASTLSRKDMEDLAAWFSSQKSALHDQR
jgi:cytochrome c553